MPLFALLTTLLHTLLCILHCHLLPPALLPISTIANQPMFICHTPGSEAPATPTPIDPATLQALHSPAPAAAGPSLIVLVLVAPLLLACSRKFPLLYNAPDPPPPRPAAA